MLGCCRVSCDVTTGIGGGAEVGEVIVESG